MKGLIAEKEILGLNFLLVENLEELESFVEWLDDIMNVNLTRI